jgi:hypothetical protein
MILPLPSDDEIELRAVVVVVNPRYGRPSDGAAPQSPESL